MFPYHLGYRRNFTQVINWSGRCRGNGLEWEVVEGCFEFSLTAEQLEQKKLKRKQAVSHFIYFYRHLVPCPEIEGHWSLYEHLGQMATQVWICSDNIYYMMYIGGLANIPLTGQLSGQISILISTSACHTCTIYTVMYSCI